MDHRELTPEMLLNAYASGVFPMADSRDDPRLYWVEPRERGVIPLEGFHISRSLARLIRQERYAVAVNTDFAGVVTACADRPETWINGTIFDLYCQLHALGFAHSLEIYEGRDLVGGVYGVALGQAFFGESMFSRRDNTSKLALAHLVARLKRAGATLFDTQFLTDHLASLGAIEVPRAHYLALLDRALEDAANWDSLSAPMAAQEVLQAKGQRS